jgi:hypothetical protein
MTDPVLLLDSTVLVAYERDLTRRAQALVLEALADGRLLATPRCRWPWRAPSWVARPGNWPG